MKIIFMGTPDFAVPALHALVAAGHEVICAYTQPPRPGGRRGKELTPTPVHKAADALGIEVRHPVSLKGAEDQAAFAALEADVAVVAAYGLILPQGVLDAPKHGCLNIHASLLPRWRGAAPIQRAILAGDEQTGVTIMQMERGLDTGPMLAVVKTPVDGKTAGELTAELAELGASLMVDVLADLPGHAAVTQPEEGVTYAHKIDKAELHLRFDQGCDETIWQIRALNPPGAYFEFAGERIRVLNAVPLAETGLPGTVLDDGLGIACTRGAIRPTLVQRAGRNAMSVDELLRGFPIPIGSSLA
ncbi:MAG: methionyl-tRNA formyltransferase [Sphingomonadaceae bacterium]